MSTGRALIVVDEQVDFCEGGALAVEGGNAVCSDTAAWIRANRDRYDLIVATKDWHVDPGDHFADEPDYVDTWPHHCVADTEGAELHPEIRSLLDEGLIDTVVAKGQTEAAYSGFEAKDLYGRSLEVLLRDKGVDSVDVAGLATDYCVKATVLDACENGFGANLLVPLAAGVAGKRPEDAIAEMAAAGAGIEDTLSPTRPGASPQAPAPRGVTPRGAGLCGAPTKASDGTLTGPPCQKRVAFGAATCGERGHHIPAARWVSTSGSKVVASSIGPSTLDLEEIL